MLTILYSPFPSIETARQAAGILLTQRAVACCNLLGGCESHYLWQGTLTQATEVILIAKTTADAAAHARQILAANHPYECPAILSFSADSNAKFAAWLGGCVSGATPMHQSD